MEIGLKELNIKRGAIKARLTNFKKYLDGIINKESLSDAEILELQQKTNRIRQSGGEFADIQCQIESIDANLEDQYAEREIIENNFDSYLALASSVISRYQDESGGSEKSRSAKSDRSHSGQSHNSNSSAVIHSRQQNFVKLRPIDIPTFDGTPETWLEFRDSFKSMVHENSGLHNIQKYHHLRACLQGKAAHVIKSVDFTADDYPVAYQALLERYDNPRKLIDNDVKSLFQMEKINKASSNGLRTLIDSFCKHLLALKKVGKNVDNWNTLIIHLLVTKLNDTTLGEWEKYCDIKDIRDEPQFDDLKKFLLNRADFLERFESKKVNESRESWRFEKSRNKSHSLVGTEVKCPVCDKQHKSNSSSNPVASTSTTCLSSHENRQVLLSTALIEVQLNLNKSKIDLAVSGLNNNVFAIKSKSFVRFRSTRENYTKTISCYILPTITGVIPNVPINTVELNIPSNISLADPSFCEPCGIDILIGAEFFWELLLNNEIRLGKGPIALARNRVSTSLCCLATGTDVQTQLNKFWEVEEVDYKQVLSKEQELCETHFLNTTTHDGDGRFVVKIPLKGDVCSLGNSKKISRVLLHDFYVDDLLTAVDSVDEAIFIYEQVSKVLRSGCFELRKWLSNSEEIMTFISSCNTSEHSVKIGDKDVAKTLGLVWNSKEDNLSYRLIEFPQNIVITKRVMLSEISQIYDPLCLLSACTILAKIILQQLWLIKLTWDEIARDDVLLNWCKFRDNLSSLNSLCITRHVICENPTLIEMHGFCDVSEAAYGGCIYILSKNQQGDTFVNLLCAKTKVAPIKSLTIPKLELCIALILAKLARKVIDSVRIKFDCCTFWADSTIVLGWLRTSPHLLKVFVGNRVAEILSLTGNHQWRHVDSKQNPADLLSRGVFPEQLVNCKIWWKVLPFSNRILLNGPILVFLLRTYQNFDQKRQLKCSSLSTLKRVISWIYRFVENCRKPKEERNFESLSVKEIDTSFCTEDHVPPSLWRLGSVIAIHSGVDGQARVATLKTSHGEVRRAFSKICPLPLDN
nr:unnamed protein product [Callosobruchus chinensis]